MAFNWAGILAATLAILPMGLVLLVSYGRYDGHFRDNVVFLNLVAGMAVGILVAVFLLFSGTAVLFVAVFALVLPLVVTAIANRRKWQGERHAVWNAGALAAGASSMIALTLWRDRMPAVGLDPALRLLAGASALTLVYTAGGLAIGAAVFDRKPFQGLGLAVLAALPVGFLLFEFLSGGAWLWAVLALVLAGGAYAYADRRILPVGATEEGRRRDRRAARAKGGT